MNKQELIEKCLEKTREYLEVSIPESIEDFNIKLEYESGFTISSKSANTNYSEFAVEFYI